MSETEPLLRGASPSSGDNGQLYDHPIFLRVAHSPWSWLDQNVLCYLRLGIVTYVTAAYGMILHWKIQSSDDEHSAWRIFFQFSTITWTLVLVYHILATAWTITHLHWPRLDPSDRTWESNIIRLLQPPEQPGNARRRFYFSLFYSLVQTYSIMLFIIYWTVLINNGHAHGPDLGGVTDFNSLVKALLAEGWFKLFCVFHTWSFPAILATYEVFFLNAIQRQVPVPSHVFAIQFVSVLYLAWASLGKLLTGHNPFHWFDDAVLGSREAAAAYSIGFLLLSAGSFASLYGFIGMREAITEHEAKHDDPEEPEP